VKIAVGIPDIPLPLLDIGSKPDDLERDSPFVHDGFHTDAYPPLLGLPIRLFSSSLPQSHNKHITPGTAK
jgi:hypothetical protein